ncbi:hypothetical protein D9753_25150 [Streptomyces dangxiongensis]|uniref:Uncharacterized protein n=1 Tax=Streptomyces dangxiongensis TaxID=1442032 RepID=A0A3G2JM32_9ACTN|nr:hypothetical protein D9753_25150 [Streptomyces dangxiongensis]
MERDLHCRLRQELRDLGIHPPLDLEELVRAYSPTRLPLRALDKHNCRSWVIFRGAVGLVSPRSAPARTGPHGSESSQRGSHAS